MNELVQIYVIQKDTGAKLKSSHNALIIQPVARERKKNHERNYQHGMATRKQATRCPQEPAAKTSSEAKQNRPCYREAQKQEHL
jgi:hypothetical protein